MRVFSIGLTVLTLCTALTWRAAAERMVAGDVVAAGGARMQGGGYILGGTVGQALIGHAAQDREIDAGFWYVPSLEETSGATELNDLPEIFSLCLSSSNPGREAIRFRVSLPVDCHVTVNLFDVRGRVVRILADGPYRAGFHSIVIEAAGLPSGIYFCRMKAGFFVQTRRAVLLR